MHVIGEVEGGSEDPGTHQQPPAAHIEGSENVEQFVILAVSC